MASDVPQTTDSAPPAQPAKAPATPQVTLPDTTTIYESKPETPLKGEVYTPVTLSTGDNPDEVPDDVRFAAVWSNPAIRIGKVALHEMLLRWLGRLTDDGEALMVVHHHLGSDSLQRWLDVQGLPTERLASSQGYRILRTRRG